MRSYRLVRSRRKTAALIVREDGSLEVRAPLRLPKDWIDRFVQEKENWIQQKTQEMAARRALQPSFTPEEEKRLRKQAQEFLPRRVWELSRQTGLVPSGVKITGAKSRWGSCSGKNSICLSWRLVVKSPELIDYVIIHELCHTVHHDHSPRFWALVETFLPDYRQRRLRLRKEGAGCTENGENIF